MAKHCVAITDYLHDELGPEQETLAGIAEIEALNVFSEQALEGKVEEADALIVYHTFPITAATLSRLKRCRVIARAGVGFDNVDIGAARRLGIPVANIPDYGTEEVADSCLALMLSLTRGVNQLNLALQREEIGWERGDYPELLRLRGRTLGIVGLGRVGTAMALRVRALGMRVIYYDPYKPRGYDKALGVERVDRLEELLEQSFVLSLHCPLTDETREMIDQTALERLPRGAYLVNTARGAVVENAVIPGLIASGQLAGAGLDVLEQEPPPQDHPLVRAWKDPDHVARSRVILNPHRAFYSREGILEMRRKSAETCLAALQGTAIPNVVND